MLERNILVLSGDEVADVLAGQELAVVDAVSKAYQVHGQGQSSLPHSTFLHFPNNPANRIIALPAYLGGEVNSAGVKWIASFPANVNEGFDRASAVLILNSPENGRPSAILESSIISARRTAASAALAARVLTVGRSRTAGLIGCGVINFEIVRFLPVTCPDIDHLLVYDLSADAARNLQERCAEEFPKLKVEIAANSDTVFRNAGVISFATTSGKPWVHSLKMCAPGTAVLHISLRDLAPDVILDCDNVVDDVDHVSRAQTSIHLTEQKAGNRGFIRCTLAGILQGKDQPRADRNGIAVFSPFGLGILDIALGELVLKLARQKGRGTVIESFLPAPWRKTSSAVVA